MNRQVQKKGDRQREWQIHREYPWEEAELHGIPFWGGRLLREHGRSGRRGDSRLHSEPRGRGKASGAARIRGALAPSTRWCGLGSCTFVISRTEASRNHGNCLNGTNSSRSPTNSQNP